MVEPSDHQLWDASRQGDGAAFETLVERYEAAVCAVTWAWTRNRVDSEELAQEAFARAWQRLSQLREPEKIGAWLCGIARNVARRHRSSPTTVDVVDRLPADGSDPESITAARQQHAVVRDALSRLPPRYREPLVLYYRQGCSSREVAEVLGVSANVIDQRLSRGRRMLRADVERVLADVVGPPAPRGRVRERVAALLPGLGLPGADARPTMVTLALGVVTMKKAIAIAAALLLVVLVAAVAGGKKASPDSTRASAAIDVGASSDARKSAAEGDVEAVRNARERLRDESSSAVTQPKPAVRAPMEPSRQGNIYTVNLEGGPSRMIVARSAQTTLNAVGGLPDEPMNEDNAKMLGIILAGVKPPEAMRSISGVVTNSDGKPVSGATVLAGDRVGAHWGGLEAYAEGSSAAVTNGAGAFSVEVDGSKAASVVAITRKGWSNVSRVEAGTSPVELTLRLDAEAKLVGHTTRGGEPEPAHVVISTSDGMFYEVETDAIGDFEVDPVSPGRYLVSAYRDNGSDMAATDPGHVEVVVPDTGVAEVEVAMPAGAAVAVEYAASDESATVVMGYLYEGHHDKTPTELQESAVAASAMHLLHKGVLQFSDIAPGEYTACGHLYTEMTPTASDGHALQFSGDVVGEGCKTLVVKDGDEVVEVIVPTVPRARE